MDLTDRLKRNAKNVLLAGLLLGTGCQHVENAIGNAIRNTTSLNIPPFNDPDANKTTVVVQTGPKQYSSAPEGVEWITPNRGGNEHNNTYSTAFLSFKRDGDQKMDPDKLERAGRFFDVVSTPNYTINFGTANVPPGTSFGFALYDADNDNETIYKAEGVMPENKRFLYVSVSSSTIMNKMEGKKAIAHFYTARPLQTLDKYPVWFKK